jgi:hypothetical protein
MGVNSVIIDRKGKTLLINEMFIIKWKLNDGLIFKRYDMLVM